MPLFNDFLKSDEELQQLLLKVSTLDLVKALSTRLGVIVQRQMEIQVLMIPESLIGK